MLEKQPKTFVLGCFLVEISGIEPLRVIKSNLKEIGEKEIRAVKFDDSDGGKSGQKRYYDVEKLFCKLQNSSLL